MKSILAIDAAWTITQPSGIAVVVLNENTWRCAALAPSYKAFFDLADSIPVNWHARQKGSAPEPEKLIEATRAIAGIDDVSLVTIDMPVSTEFFDSRRAADNAVSKAYGAKHCSVHSPTPKRPGPLAAQIRDGFNQAGFSVATTTTSRREPNHLVEVYPHPAIVNMMDLTERLKYKVSRSRQFWPDASIDDRKSNLVTQFRRLLDTLKNEISGIDLEIPDADNFETLTQFKAYEDALDALVCAWVGIKYLDGSAVPYGDSTAAIWIPE